MIDDCDTTSGSININTNHNKSHSVTKDVHYNSDHSVLSLQDLIIIVARKVLHCFPIKSVYELSYSGKIFNIIIHLNMNK